MDRSARALCFGFVFRCSFLLADLTLVVVCYCCFGYLVCLLWLVCLLVWLDLMVVVRFVAVIVANLLVWIRCFYMLTVFAFYLTRLLT